MIEVTAALAAAQAATGQRPSVRVCLADLDRGVPRLRWERWYTGLEPDGPCAAALTGSGALVRARIDPASGALSVQRIASPAVGSAWGTWSGLGTVTATAALGCHAAAERVLLATVAGGTQVQLRESTDGGATFSAATTVATAAATVTTVTCGVRADGSAVVAWSDGSTLKHVRRTGTGAWSAVSTQDVGIWFVARLAMYDASDWAVAISGTVTSGAWAVWTSRLGSGLGGPPGVWSTPRRVAEASAGTGVAFLAAGIGHIGAPRVVLSEYRQGRWQAQQASAVAGTTFDDHAWREPVPVVDWSGGYGLALAAGPTRAFLCSPSGVWVAEPDSEEIDVSAEVLTLRIEQRTTSDRLELTLVDDGRFAPGAAPSALSLGGEVRVDPGLSLATGAERAAGRAWWIVSVRRARHAGRTIVEIEAEGAISRLRSWRAPRALVWTAGSATQLQVAAEIARRAGFLLVGGSASAAASTLSTPFLLPAGEPAHAAIDRALGRTADLMVARGTLVTLFEPTVMDMPTAAYGTVHAIRAAEAYEVMPRAAWVRVNGAGAVGEAADFAAVRAGGGVQVVSDRALTSTALTLVRARSEARRAALEVRRARIIVAPHAGQEAGDVVEVTDAALGWDARRMRVQEVRLDYARGSRGRYEMALDLGEV